MGLDSRAGELCLYASECVVSHSYHCLATRAFVYLCVYLYVMCCRQVINGYQGQATVSIAGVTSDCVNCRKPILCSLAAGSVSTASNCNLLLVRGENYVLGEWSARSNCVMLPTFT